MRDITAEELYNDIKNGLENVDGHITGSHATIWFDVGLLYEKYEDKEAIAKQIATDWIPANKK